MFSKSNDEEEPDIAPISCCVTFKKLKEMDRILLLMVITIAGVVSAQAQKFEYKIITSVESIIPAGLGRSRLIENAETVNTADLTTYRTNGKDSKQGTIRRKDAKIDELGETKLLNFFGLAGINFQNIASNDAIVQSRLNELSEEGWELGFVASGVESDSGTGDGQGIFVTRYIFKRQK